MGKFCIPATHPGWTKSNMNPSKSTLNPGRVDQCGSMRFLPSPTFNDSFREARVIFDSLPTFWLYFLPYNFYVRFAVKELPIFRCFDSLCPFIICLEKEYIYIYILDFVKT